MSLNFDSILSIINTVMGLLRKLIELGLLDDLI